MKKLILICGIFLLAFHLQGQDVEYARDVLNKLSSKGFHGRGYVKNGGRKASDYIAKQFRKNGVLPLDSTYFQSYTFPINTITGKLSVSVDGAKLKPGDDFVISSSSGSKNGTFPLKLLPDTITSDTGFMQTIHDEKNGGYFLISNYYPRKRYGKTMEGIEGIVTVDEKIPGWHVSNGDQVQKTTWLKLKSDAIPDNAGEISISARNNYLPAFETRNVLGVVKGKTYPDRYIVFTAHYDHLGMMGNRTWFPGANDNASGTAMVLDLARHFALPENQPDYSIVFMLFSGEEAGLKGSNYYTTHPVFPLQKIDLLINLDMVGTGSEGIAVVNGEAYNNLMTDLKRINEKSDYLSEIKGRGEACNSDHCPFYKIGVKSVFIYTMGKEHMEYHSVHDVRDEFPFTAYNGLFRLLTDYVGEIQENE